MSKRDERHRSFEISAEQGSPLRQTLLRLFKRPIERLFALDRLGAVYSEVPPSIGCDEFLTNALNTLKIRYEVTEEDWEKIPNEGPIIAVANHPFGGIEGMILGSLFKARRPDVKILANFLLERIPELRDLFIFVDPFGSQESPRKNIVPLREAIDWINAGGALGVFPAGTVSHLQLQKREITDPTWSPTAARLIRKTQAAVVPIFFQGTNSFLFQLLGLLHPRLRTAMLPHELLNKQNETLRVNVGSIIPAERLLKFDEDEDLIAYLRLRTYILKNRNRPEGKEPTRARRLLSFAGKQRTEPIAPPENQRLLINEVAGLPPDQILVESGEFLVLQAWAQQIPHALHEIGRLREITFRQAHEGTGKSIDLDRFDNYYMHLFVWNKEQKQIVGAYRIGQSDKILERYGQRGLYTSTLFAYSEGLFEQLGPALELGRSFVRPEYQKSFSPLLLLWKGIGHFVAMNPDYRILFGPVSINSQYDSISRRLIANFLEGSNYLPEVARQIRPRNPLRSNKIHGADVKETSTVVRDIEEISELVREIETENTGIPVLLRQYLRLGGKLLGFNIDPDFGDVLDGLILVDLSKTERKLLEKYLGREGSAKFLAYHQAKEKEDLANHSTKKSGTNKVTKLYSR